MKRLLCIVALGFTSRLTAGDVEFNRDVRPILSNKCFACHGPDKKHVEADLRLDVEKSAKEDRGGYRVLTPGQPDKSELVRRITAEDASERMPPKKSGKTLTPAEIDVLTRWVKQGAKYQAHWAYVPPKRHPVPEVTDAGWPLNWTDRFVLARLEKEGLKPSPEADKVTLVRRLYFDLIGLPPTPREVDAFVTDADPRAYEKVVDKLLASEHFGERMAIYWLDLVRYADTVGYHGDQDHHASPYRDYVIDAFNRNIPFDRFTREQLAGDLLPDSGVDQRIASCYNRLLQTSHEGGVQPKEYLAIYLADRVRNLSAVWMGATVGCAQCHDHKFDPYTQKDFYSLGAFFADVDEEDHLHGGGRDAVPTRRMPEVPVFTRRERERIAELDRQIAKADEADRPALEAERAEIAKDRRKVMVTQAVKPRMVRVLPRGNWMDDSGAMVQSAVPAFLGKLDVGSRRANRLDLADWLTDSKAGAGGLTARVFVNRLWYLYFGVGLSKSLDDFGGQGEPPTHPELLDNLAVEFADPANPERQRGGGAEQPWDIKRMVRLLVTSHAYRQSSLEPPALREKDPENRLYARQSRMRLPAEVVRDNALSLAGLLVLDIGGKPAKPYQPAGYYRHLNFPKREYKADTGRQQWRRGVYTHWQRQFLHPMLKAFDAPSREECTAQRPRSNTPLAALVLLNDPTFVEAARVFAERVVTKGDDAARVGYAFHQATSREPDEVERGVLLKLLATERARYEADPKAAGELVRIGQAPVPKDVDVVELAAWTAVSRAILNLNETITRN
ncbi:MAG TPA: PSD1 and planctomycete cytochrome C domain-containing protein [Fimbriiglobus sp.]|nr:PSD1 and planctomycete cytochrome C domain-containing protein [Fimbriiglobus sp.]